MSTIDYRTVFDHLDEMLWVYNTDDKVLEFLSTSVEKYIGLPVGDVQKDPKHLIELLSPHDIEACTQAFYDCIERGSASIECILSSDAEECFLIKARMAEIDGKTLMIGSASNISLQKHYERSLARFAERYDKILQAALTGYVLLNLEGYIVNCNDAFAKMVKVDQNELASTNISELITPEPEGTKFMRSIRNNDKSRGVTKLRSPQGSVIPIEYTASQIDLHDRDLIVLFAEDISRKERIRKQLVRVMRHSEEVSRMKTSIMSNVSHEIKAPIHRIQGLVEILRQETSTDEVTSYLDNISESSEKVLQSLTALVEFSKLDSEVAQNHFKPVDIWKSLIEIRKELEASAHKKNLKLIIPDIDPGIVVSGDKFLLQECWRIVIGNSIKFTEKGEIKVTVDRGESEVVVRIRDTGQGIQEQFLPKVFQPFMQESDGFNRSHGGLGLGLSIARRYVDSHQGRIELASELDQGTVVTMVFPMLN